jgi:hypothetical protein
MQHASPFPADPDSMARRLIQSAHNRDGLPEIAVGLTGGTRLLRMLRQPVEPGE